MIAQVGRSEALAAVALVVAARLEPGAALRRLASEDRSLAVLTRVAGRISAGVPLHQALVDCRLLAARAAAPLAQAPPAVLAEELTRLAQRSAAPPFGEALARWFPVWVVIAASLPSLMIGTVVVIVTGTSYVSIWDAFGYYQPHHPPPITLWLLQIIGNVIALVAAAVLWSTVRRILSWCHLAVFSRSLERAAQLDDLLRLVRAGGAWQGAYRRWQWLSGDAGAVKSALERCGGDPTAALIDLGIIARTRDNRPDWRCALAEAGYDRRRESEDLVPWLMSLLVIAGVFSFMTWGVNILRWEFGYAPFLLAHTNIHGVVEILTQTGGIVVLLLVAAEMRLLGEWLRGWLAGAGRDWPRVADRLARGLERSEDPALVLRGVRFAVHRAMRRRIGRALASDEPHLGKRLVAAGIIPADLATHFAAAAPADWPALLRSCTMDDEGPDLRALRIQAKTAMTILIIVASMAAYLAQAVMPKFKVMFDCMHLAANPLIWRLGSWADTWCQWGLAAAVLAILVIALGRRRGWWTLLDGWSRLVRGLVLRRMLAASASERALADALRGLGARVPLALERAAAQGDLPGVLAAAGWPVRDAAQLDHAITAHLMRRDRRHQRLALVARLVLPLVIALPVGLISASVMLSISWLQGEEVAQANRAGGGGMTGGTPGLALLHWWSTRYEADAAAAVEAERQFGRDMHAATVIIPVAPKR